MHCPKLLDGSDHPGCPEYQFRSLVESLLRSLMHAGFIRKFEDHEIDLLLDLMSWLNVKSYGMWIQHKDLCPQYILDQLYFNVPRVVKEDFWIKNISFMETKALTIYRYDCENGPFGKSPTLCMED